MSKAKALPHLIITRYITTIIFKIIGVIILKFRHFLFIGLILAILSLGAVSASDNLTDVNVLKEGSYWDNDFYITVKENYTQDKVDWSSQELIYISSYSNDNTTLKILVDDVVKQNLSVTDGYFSKEDDGYGGTYNKYYANIYPADLGLDFGTYNIKVNEADKTLLNSQVTLKQKDDFDIWLQNPYYCEEEYWKSPSFIVIDSNHFNTGTLEILVNGSRKLNFTLTNGNFESIADCSNKSRYISPSDLFEGYGRYDVKITFEENGLTKTLSQETVQVAEFEPTTNPKLEIGFDLYYLTLPADNVVHIYLPREATGRLSISYNDVKNQTVTYSKGFATHNITSWNLNHLGENVITVTYEGDDFGTLTATGTVTVLPDINCPSYVSVGEEFSISMLTHDWVWGDFNVYDFTGDVKGNLLASDEIFKRPANQFATASVNLSSDKVGLNKYYLEFDYPGGNYPVVREVYVVENSKNVSVNVTKSAKIGSDVFINIKAAPAPFSFLYISVDDGPFEMFSMQTGEVSKKVSFSAKGYHDVSIKYDGRYWDSDGKYIGDVYSNTFIVNVGCETEIISDDVITVYKASDNLKINLKDETGSNLANREIIIRLDGKTYVRNTDENGIALLQLDLDAGNYSAEIAFEGLPGYLASNVTAKITVKKAETKLLADDISMYYGQSRQLTIRLSLNDSALANRKILISLNGADYNRTTDINGQVSLPLNLGVGEYKALFNFSGDENCIGSAASSKIVVSKSTTKLIAPKVNAVYNSGKNLVITLRDAGNKVVAGRYVSFKLAGKNYNMKTDKNGQVKLAINLAVKTYEFSVNFKGDGSYLKSSAKVKIVVSKATPKLTAPNKSFKLRLNAKKITATLKDNKGKVMKNTKLTLKLNGKSYSAKTNSKGVATFTVKISKRGTFSGNIKFAGNSNFKSASKTVKITVYR